MRSESKSNNHFHSRTGAVAVELIHRSNGSSERLATDVRLADSLLQKSLGLMGKRPLRDGECLVFRFGESDVRHVHTFFVRAPIDVIWVAGERVIAVETMHPWNLGRRHSADTIVELPAGAATGVSEGDIVRLDP